jgi:hypothetical protein
MKNKVTVYPTFEAYLLVRDRVIDKKRERLYTENYGDKTGSKGLRQLKGMQGKTWMHNFFTKRITGFEVVGEYVIIHTTRKEIKLPLKNLFSQLNKEFLPAALR